MKNSIQMLKKGIYFSEEKIVVKEMRIDDDSSPARYYGLVWVKEEGKKENMEAFVMPSSGHSVKSFFEIFIKELKQQKGLGSKNKSFRPVTRVPKAYTAILHKVNPNSFKLKGSK